ncbi:MAG: hypothetical protein HON90_00530 [Halobacteriovoraceae bacterium]|jgi:predicted extracellular nuclease|nr:hypothetical protein [Halobacteriovoraceae bacterium]
MQIIRAIFIFLAISSCSQDSYKRSQKDVVISAATSPLESSSAGNLVASAIKEVNDLDMVFYPKDLLIKDNIGLYSNTLSEQQKQELISILPLGTLDQFYIGNMAGKNIKKFLYMRTIEKYEVELEVAGVKYNFIFKGGFPLSKSVRLENGGKLIDDQFYRVAISKYFYAPGDIFPSYTYRNGIDRIFKNTFIEVSARDCLYKYLSDSPNYIPSLTYKRAMVKLVNTKERGELSISQVQGESHLSPFMGETVTVRGIVTAMGALDWYPGGTEFYLQSEVNDNNPKTSEAIHVYISEFIPEVELGDLVEVKAEVYEEITLSGLTRTQLRKIKKMQVIGKRPLPKALAIGKGFLPIPNQQISTYVGNINFKKSLKLTDGIDFWESLEGMRVSIKDVRVVGFRGGKESSDPSEEKDHLTLFLLPDGKNPNKILTNGGGVLPNPDQDLWNPQIITLVSNNLSTHLDTKVAYNVGDIIEGQLTGIIQYSKNLFGDGEYTLILPQAQSTLDKFTHKERFDISCLEEKVKTVLLICRPRVEQKQSDDSLSIASYNLKNLSSNDQSRIDETGDMITNSLGCPDILGLVEVQDDNGLDFMGNSHAQITINKIIAAIDCDGKSYRSLNINPSLHTEGGQPGGNIRVAMIFDENKLGFTRRGVQGARVETRVLRGGILSTNPGRIFPNERAFLRTRKSIIAQFDFRGESIYVIVNHFNSKLGDSGQWGAVHPIKRGSERKRAKLAYKMNDFVTLIERRNPKAKIAVIGDFNAYLNEAPMKILEGHSLFNLMRTLPVDQRYTTNHNGNSQSLDYIFINKGFQANEPMFKVLHLNSDYMGRLSDHDPIYSLFNFR